MKISKYFNRTQLLGLQKAGDVILPGTDLSPSFSRTGCIDHVDRLAAYLSRDDLGGLQVLLRILRHAPKWSIHLLMKACGANARFPGFAGTALRTIDIGLKGLVMSLYYSNLTGPDYQGKKVFDIVGWNAKLIMSHEDAPTQAGQAAINYDHPDGSGVAAIFARARQAQPGILAWGLNKRLEFISRLKAIIVARQADILDRIQAETGKSRTDALTAEIFGTLDHLDYLEKMPAKCWRTAKCPRPSP